MRYISTAQRLRHRCMSQPSNDESMSHQTYLNTGIESLILKLSTIGLKPKELRFIAANRILNAYISQKGLQALPYQQILLIWLKDGDSGIDSLFSDEEILDLLQVRSEKQAYNRLLFLINQTLKSW